MDVLDPVVPDRKHARFVVSACCEGGKDET